MERERNDSGSETGEASNEDVQRMIQLYVEDLEADIPVSRTTRTSSEEELTLLTENADPTVRDPHIRDSIFWPPRSQMNGITTTVTTRGSSSAPYYTSNSASRRIRPNRPWTARERYYRSHQNFMTQPYLYYRQYLRQEILRTYMSPVHRLPSPPALMGTRERLPAVFTWSHSGLNSPFLQISAYRPYISPQIIRQGVSGSSNGSNGSLSTTTSAPDDAGTERVPFVGMGEADIQQHTLLIKQDENENDMTCVICMSLMTNELLRKLPCRHTFHKDCIDTWLGVNGICPTCRQGVRQSSP